jgi:hypothetical protein
MKRSLATVSSVVVATLALTLPGPARAYESDVHFGLTRWLALRAGFEESQADAIATADQHVDGDMIETLELGIEFACAGAFPGAARQAQHGHYPSAAALPSPPANRAVLPGSDAARAALIAVRATLSGKEGLMLGKFGAALHPLQDSWAHQGIASVPRVGASLRCDATLAYAHPAARGGPGSHAADASAPWPADALAMARATYDELVGYPAIDGRSRKAAPWESLLPVLQGFVKGTTKTQKRTWFVGQGMQDTRFLGGISLPDGPDPGGLEWNGRRFLALPGNGSMQHDAPADARAFVDRLLARWLGAERVETVVAEMAGSPAGARPSAAAPWPSARELAARLKLWKMRDHGSAAEIVHAPSPLGPAQLRAAERLAGDPRALIAPTEVSQAVYALQPATQAPMPLLPYILHTLPASGGASKMVAIAKLRHAPYDSIGWVIERRANGWTLVDVVASVHP